MTEVSNPTEYFAERDGQISLLLELMREIDHGADVEVVFWRVRDTLRAMFGIDRFGVSLADEDGSLHLLASDGLSREYVERVRAAMPLTPGMRVMQTGVPLFVLDAQTSPEYSPLQEAAVFEGFRTALFFPLFSRNEPLGFLAMYHDNVRPYSPSELRLAQAVATQAGVAMAHARLLGRMEERRTELERQHAERRAEAEATDRITLRIASSLDLQGTFQSIVDAATELSNATTGALYLRGEDGLFRAVAAVGISLESLQGVTLSRDRGLMARMCATGESAQVLSFEEEVTATSELARSYVSDLSVQSTLGIPLIQDGECIGALYVAQQSREAFPDDAIRMLKRLASFARVAVRNAERFTVLETERSQLELDRERARTHLLSELLELSAFLNSDPSIPVLIERVVEAAMRLVGASAGTLGLVEDETLVFRRYHLPGGWTDFDVKVHRGEGAPGHVWETEKPYVSNATASDGLVLQTYRRQLGFSRLVYVPVFDRSGKIVGALGVYDPVLDRDFGQSDVEALQLLAHQAAIALENARLNELKDEFLSIVSHELKTPVTSIKGFTQILQRRLPTDVLEGSRRYLNVINHQADRLTGLINDLLDLSRIRTGRFVFDIEPLDYGAMIADVLAEMRLVSPGNTITYDGPDHLELRGNADRLRQVLVNLIDNGIKHGPPEGTIHVTMETRQDIVRTYVCDEGQGLPPGEDERIFAQYYQVRRGSERHARGLGLGLFISRQIIEEHGGRIWLDKAHHTSFCYDLPHPTHEERAHEGADIHAHPHSLPEAQS